MPADIRARPARWRVQVIIVHLILILMTIVGLTAVVVHSFNAP